MHLGKKISLEMYEQGSHRNNRLPFVLDWFLPPRLLYEGSGGKKIFSYEYYTESRKLWTNDNTLDLTMQARVLIELQCRLESATASLLSDIRKLELQ